ncbi:hypothetical protein BDQ17DRAFT_1374268, partial [Cyathus striatus]
NNSELDHPGLPAVPTNASDVSQYVYNCTTNDNTIKKTYVFTSTTPLSAAALEGCLTDAHLVQERDIRTAASEFISAPGIEGGSNTTTTHCCCSYFASDDAPRSRSCHEVIREVLLSIVRLVGIVMLLCSSFLPLQPAVAGTLEGAGSFLQLIGMLPDLPTVYSVTIGLVMAVTYPFWVPDFVNVQRFK